MACVVPARTGGQINVPSQPRLCEGRVGGLKRLPKQRERERKRERDIHMLAHCICA